MLTVALADAKKVADRHQKELAEKEQAIADLLAQRSRSGRFWSCLFRRGDNTGPGVVDTPPGAVGRLV